MKAKKSETKVERFEEALRWVRSELIESLKTKKYTKETLVHNCHDRINAALREGSYTPRTWTDDFGRTS